MNCDDLTSFFVTGMMLNVMTWRYLQMNRNFSYFQLGESLFGQKSLREPQQSDKRMNQNLSFSWDEHESQLGSGYQAFDPQQFASY
jgi:hypothetical protein